MLPSWHFHTYPLKWEQKQVDGILTIVKYPKSVTLHKHCFSYFIIYVQGGICTKIWDKQHRDKNKKQMTNQSYSDVTKIVCDFQLPR